VYVSAIGLGAEAPKEGEDWSKVVDAILKPVTFAIKGEFEYRKVLDQIRTARKEAERYGLDIEQQLQQFYKIAKFRAVAEIAAEKRKGASFLAYALPIGIGLVALGVPAIFFLAKRR
jgi:uncharacterized NAD(P)/FAD-binding protein YdhS